MSIPDLAHRFPLNPLLRPSDVRPSRSDFKVECLLNPGVFRFEDMTWLVVRVAERPGQKPGCTTLPVMNAAGGIDILEFDNADPLLNLSDPRIIR
jgi:beta-1,2-mannobiose phosphorylase / 1,2-beta-oligomannan phosphorylase